MRIFVLQFLLQKKVELAIAAGQQRCFTKFFLNKPHLCMLALIPFSANEQVIDRECIVKMLQSAIPGVREIAGSFWRWLHYELPYMCFYIEIEKLRGAECSSHELHSLGTFFEEQLTAQVHAPSIFWPFMLYNPLKPASRSLMRI